MNFIFDFDGTIADSFHVVLEIASEVGRGIGVKLDKEQVDTYRNMSSRNVIRHFKIPLWRLPKLLKLGMKQFEAHIPDVDTFPGLEEALAGLKKRGDRLFILTSNNNKNVQTFLRLRKLDMYFDNLYTGSSIFGKAPYIRRIVRKEKLVKNETFYVGDETRDIQAAKRAGVKIVSVAWGFNHQSILSRYHPTILIHSPAELLDIV